MAIDADIYPRTVAVTRTTSTAAAGLGAYSQMNAKTETAIIGAVAYASGTSTFVSLTGVPANIYGDASDRSMSLSLPSGARKMEYRIAIPQEYSTLGTITEGDIVTDDIGKRYQVSAATWTVLGYSLRASLLEL